MATVADLKVVFSGDSSGAEAASHRAGAAIGALGGKAKLLGGVAAAAIRALMPSSPAKKGPLSKPIDWSYIVNDLAKNMDQLGPVAHQGVMGAAREFDRYGSFAVAGSMSMAGHGRGGTTEIHHHHPVTVIALKSDEYLDLLRKAERGESAHRGMGHRAREINLGPGRR